MNKKIALSFVLFLSDSSHAMWQTEVAQLYADYCRKEKKSFPLEILRNSGGVCFGLVVKWFQEEVLNPQRRLTESVNILDDSRGRWTEPMQTEKTLVNEV